MEYDNAGNIIASATVYASLKDIGEEKDDKKGSEKKKNAIKAENLQKRKIKYKKQKMSPEYFLQLLQFYGANEPVSENTAEKFTEEYEKNLENNQG